MTQSLNLLVTVFGAEMRRYWRIRTLVLLWAACLLAFGLCAALHTSADLRARAEAVPSCGAQETTEYTGAARQARELVKEMMSERDIPGLSAAVAVEGKIVWSEGFGYANVEQQIPACPETQFRIASVSKALTSAAVAQLHEPGKLDLDAPVQRYVPSFPDKGYTITTRELAGHRAGIRHYRDDEVYHLKHYASVMESLKVFDNDPLLFPPGTRFSYSSYGYVLISAAVEGASGEDFLTYMHQHIFEPLGMRHTVEDRADVFMPHRAHFYDGTKDGPLVDCPYTDTSVVWAAGGFLSTAEDLVRFGSAYLGGNFLKPETVKLFFTMQSKIPVLPLGYGWAGLLAAMAPLRRPHGWHARRQSRSSPLPGRTRRSGDVRQRRQQELLFHEPDGDSAAFYRSSRQEQ